MTNCMGCRKQSELNSLRAAVKRFEDGREYSKLSDEIIRKSSKISFEIMVNFPDHTFFSFAMLFSFFFKSYFGIVPNTDFCVKIYKNFFHDLPDV